MSDARSDEVVVFLAKLRGGKGRSFSVEIPPDALARLGVVDGDYLVVEARKAHWYHLLAWDEGSLNDPELSDDIKREVRRLREVTGRE
ncbi:MAG: hypothetical protein C0167_00415 [Nitrososphaera sp.]|nr:MAG: hypothetical protein C0167_00415 [Nitrososphaera sp.]